MALDSAQQLGTFAREHGSDDHFNSAIKTRFERFSKRNLLIERDGLVVDDILDVRVLSLQTEGGRLLLDSRRRENLIFDFTRSVRLCFL